MSDQEYIAGGSNNWWDSSSTSARFDGGTGGNSSTTATLASGGASCGYGWLTDSPTAADMNIAVARSSMDSKIEASTLQLVGLGLSSEQGLEWNHHHHPTLLNRNTEEGDNSYGVMIEEEMRVGMGLNPPNFQHETPALFGSHLQWTPNQDSSPLELKQIGRRLNFSPENSHHQCSPSCSSMESTVTCQGLTASSAIYGFIGSDPQNQYQMNYMGLDNQHCAKVPQFLKSSPTHFTNYFNAAAQIPMPVFEDKPNKLQQRIEVKDRSSENNNNNTKRGRNETATSTLPPFKVRKEKMGDRITALQQLVSPFGKTDTASVLSEAIEYIKFLHEQVSVLTTPYMKSGTNSNQHHQQGGDKAKANPEKTGQDLRSRGLCLVPVSSTFPMTHETTVDFWTPTFGGTF